MHTPLLSESRGLRLGVRRLFLAVAFIALGFAAYAAIRAYQVYDDVRHTVHIVPRATEEPTVMPSSFGGNRRLNVLVLGSDNDKKKEEAHPLSQSMIVVSIDPVHAQVSMISIPRDFWVKIRGHGYGKIDLTYKYGGVELARETIERYLHIGINYYAWVGLGGFIKVIDTFNGVTLDATHPILDDSYPYDLNQSNPYGYQRVFMPAGWQHMDGSQALEYVRSRHGDRIGDFSRSARQQQVLLQLRAKLNGLDLIQSLPALAHELRNSVRTDISSLSDYVAIYHLSRRIRAGDIRQVVLSYPAYCNYATIQGQSVLVPYWNKIVPYVHGLVAPVTTGPASRPPSGRPAGETATSAPARTAAARSTPTALARERPTATSTSTPQPPFAHLTGNVYFVKSGDLYRLDAGGTVSQITRTGDIAMPSASPRDANQLAVVRFPVNQFVSDVWLLNSRTGAMKRVTDGRSRPFDVRNNLWAAWPSWTADGKVLLFSWDRTKLALPPSDGRPVDLALWRIGLDGSAPTEVTPPDYSLSPTAQSQLGDGGDTEPAVRPSGGQYVYVKWSYVGNTNVPSAQLYLGALGSPGSGQPLTPPGGPVLDPSWAPAGDRLAFVRTTNGREEIAVATLEQIKGQPVLGPRVVLASGRVGHPVFSPDGRWVAFERAQQDGFALYVAPSGGGTARQVEQLGASLDGRWQIAWTR